MLDVGAVLSRNVEVRAGGPGVAAWDVVRDCSAGKLYPPGKKTLPGEAGKDLLE
jgi:hypothetical protein